MARTRRTRSVSSPTRSTPRCSAASATASGCAVRSPAGATAGATPTSRLADDVLVGERNGAVINVQFFAPARMRLRPMLQKHRLRLGRRHEGAGVRLPRLLRTHGSHRPEDDRHRPEVHARRHRPVARRDRAPPGRRRAARPRTRRRPCHRCRCGSVPSPASAPPPGTTSATNSNRAGSDSSCPSSTCGCRASSRRAHGRGRDRHARPARAPRRDRRHPGRRREERTRRVRRRGHRPHHRREPGAGAHRAGSRGRPQRRRRGGAHRAEDTDRVRRRADRPRRHVSRRHRNSLELDRATGRRARSPRRPTNCPTTAHRIARHTHAAVERADERLAMRVERLGRVGPAATQRAQVRLATASDAPGRALANDRSGEPPVGSTWSPPGSPSLDPAVQVARGWSITRRGDGTHRPLGRRPGGRRRAHHPRHRRFDPQHRPHQITPTTSPAPED